MCCTLKPILGKGARCVFAQSILMAYATLAQVREEIKLGVGETEDDSYFAAKLERAQALIELWTKRTFEASADVTHYLDARADVNGSMLMLRGEFCAFTSVTNGDGVVVASNQYVTEPRNATPYYALTLKRSSGKVWTYTADPENAIVIVGRRAYSVTPPTDIVNATIRLTAVLYRQRDSSPGLDQAVVSPDGVPLIPPWVPKDVRETVLLRRKMGLA